MRGEMKTFFFAPNHCKLEIIVCVTSAYTSHWWLSEWMNWDKALCMVISFRPTCSNSKWIRIEKASSPVSNSCLLSRVIRRNWCFYTSILIYLNFIALLRSPCSVVSVNICIHTFFVLFFSCFADYLPPIVLFWRGMLMMVTVLGNWMNCCANQFNMIMEKSSHFAEFLQLLHSFPAIKKREKDHFQVDWIKNASFVICQTENSVLQTHFYDSNCVHFVCTTFCSLHYIDGNYWEFFFISFILGVTSNPMES